MRTLLQSGQDTYHSILQQMSSVHPFAIDGTGFQTSTEVSAALNQQLRNSKRCSTYKLPNTTSAIDKFRNQIPGIATVVNTWWLWVDYARLCLSLLRQ